MFLKTSTSGGKLLARPWIRIITLPSHKFLQFLQTKGP
jgi:hypothetical protein